MLALGAFAAAAPLPAFPGAEGFGAGTAAGRNGDVYHVTNLSADPKEAGSFAYGIAGVPQSGRTIVFDVSGYIPINGKLTLNHGNVTIAGQTAPGDGIGFTGGTFLISASDVVIRHVRFRNGRSADSLNLDVHATNCIVDHCDVLLGKDENLSSFRRPADNFTFSWSINGWGLETHSAGGLWDFHHATSHHSLWTHNHTRNPKARPALLDWINNVTFDYDIGFILGDSQSTADWKANIIGSWFISPPGNLRPYALEKARLQTADGQPNFSLFIADSAMDANGDGVLNESKSGYAIASGIYHTNRAPFAGNGIKLAPDDRLTAYKKVISAVGPLRLEADSTRPLRDELDSILVSNVVNQIHHHVHNVMETGASNGGLGQLQTGSILTDRDGDGMPDLWEQALGSNPNADDHAQPVTASAFGPNQTNGYTLLEAYLHFLASPHGMTDFVPTNQAPSLTAGVGGLAVDLHRFTSGFTNHPPIHYSLSEPRNGTVKLTDDHIAVFEPIPDYSGRAQFDFTVTDGDGSKWTQTFSIIVLSRNQTDSQK